MSYTYEQQNNEIFKDAFLFSIISLMLEIVFFIVYYFADLITYDIRLYILKNLISPSIITVGSIIIGYIIYKKNYSKKVNDLCATTVLAIPSCVMTMFHCAYPEISLCMVIPMVLTALFYNQKILKTQICIYILSITATCIISITRHDFKVVNAILHYLICIAIIICCYCATNIILRAYSDKMYKIVSYIKREEKLNDLVKKDSITGLYNNMAIKAIVKISMDAYKDNILIAMIDIDDFKQINDLYGHTFGDEVISFAAEILKEITSEQIRCGRYGGDEFLIIATEISVDSFKMILSNAINQFEKKYHDYQITISCGIAQMSDDIKNELDFINKADKALYEVKNSGKNNIIINK